MCFFLAKRLLITAFTVRQGRRVNATQILMLSQLAKTSELRIKGTAGVTGSADRRLGSVRKAMPPIDHGNEKLASAPIAQLIKDLQPAFGALGLFDQQAQHFLAIIRAHAKRKRYGLVLDPPLLPNLQPQRIKRQWETSLQAGASAIGPIQPTLHRRGSK